MPTPKPLPGVSRLLGSYWAERRHFARGRVLDTAEPDAPRIAAAMHTVYHPGMNVEAVSVEPHMRLKEE